MEKGSGLLKIGSFFGNAKAKNRTKPEGLQATTCDKVV